MEISVDPYILILSPTNSIVRLREREGKKRAIDLTLNAISLYNLLSVANSTKTDRPIIHKLMVNALSVLGSAIEKVVVDNIIDGLFHSHIYLKRDGQVHLIDAHVTDAIGLAIVQRCPLLVLEDVFAKSAEEQARRRLGIQRMSDEEELKMLQDIDPDKLLKC